MYAPRAASRVSSPSQLDPYEVLRQRFSAFRVRRADRGEPGSRAALSRRFGSGPGRRSCPGALPLGWPRWRTRRHAPPRPWSCSPRSRRWRCARRSSPRPPTPPTGGRASGRGRRRACGRPPPSARRGCRTCRRTRHASRRRATDSGGEDRIDVSTSAGSGGPTSKAADAAAAATLPTRLPSSRTTSWARPAAGSSADRKVTSPSSAGKASAVGSAR